MSGQDVGICIVYIIHRFSEHIRSEWVSLMLICYSLLTRLIRGYTPWSIHQLNYVYCRVDSNNEEPLSSANVRLMSKVSTVQILTARKNPFKSVNITTRQLARALLNMLRFLCFKFSDRSFHSMAMCQLKQQSVAQVEREVTSPLIVQSELISVSSKCHSYVPVSTVIIGQF